MNFTVEEIIQYADKTQFEKQLVQYILDQQRIIDQVRALDALTPFNMFALLNLESALLQGNVAFLHEVYREAEAMEDLGSLMEEVIKASHWREQMTDLIDKLGLPPIRDP